MQIRAHFRRTIAADSNLILLPPSRTAGGRILAAHVGLKLRRVTSICATPISGFSKRRLDPTRSVVSDGLQCFGSVAEAGCAHQVVKTGSP
jgi:hypothetical protein